MTDEQESTLYAVLDVNPNASTREIDDAYERMMSFLAAGSMAAYSMLGEDELTAQREQVEEAYAILSDPHRRAVYDRDRASGDTGYPPVVVSSRTTEPSVTVGRVERSSSSLSTSSATEPSPKDDVSFASESSTSHASKAPSAPIETVPRGPQGSRPPHEDLASSKPKEASKGQEEVDTGSKSGRRLVSSVELPNLEAGDELSGSVLKRIREGAGASLADVAKITKISRRYLKALEENDYDTLPAPVYIRGFVSEYAKVIGLPPNRAAKAYMTLVERYRHGGES